MKKRFLMFTAAAMLAAALAGCGQSTQKSDTQMGYIGEDAARSMAATAAQVNLDDATFAQTELDEKNGTVYYDVEFTVDGTHYSYAIDAMTGTVIESGSKAAEYGSESAGGTAQTGGAVDEAKAKQIALDHAGVSEDDTSFMQVQADRDDGVSVFEVEFYVASTGTEYDYEIDASTGEIRGFDHDAEHYTAGQQSANTSSGQAKSEDEIRAIALAKVPGATEKDIRLELDRDDGKLRYEGKIIYEGMEYDFEIDAYSGAIQEWEAESVFD